MSLLELRTAVVAGIKAGMPTLKLCDAHGGRFDLAELKRYAVQAPCVLVACLDSDDLELDGGTQLCGDIRMAAYLVTRGSSSQDRGAEALVYAEALAALIAGNAWGRAEASAARRVRLSNLYSDALDRAGGVALWGVSWAQPLDLAVYDPSALAAFEQAQADYHLAREDEDDDTVDAQDTVDLEQPEE